MDYDSGEWINCGSEGRCGWVLYLIPIWDWVETRRATSLEDQGTWACVFLISELSFIPPCVGESQHHWTSTGRAFVQKWYLDCRHAVILMCLDECIVFFMLSGIPPPQRTHSYTTTGQLSRAVTDDWLLLVEPRISTLACAHHRICHAFKPNEILFNSIWYLGKSYIHR